MAKSTAKTKNAVDEALEQVTRRRESDETGVEYSEDSEESHDSVAEERFIDEEDKTFDKLSSDVDWEPVPSATPSRSTRVVEPQSTTSEDGSHPSTPRRGTGSRRRTRGRGRKRRRARGRHSSSSSSSSQADASSSTEEKWNDIGVQDIMPPQPTFRPTKTPGPQLILTAKYTVLQLFQLFFTNSVLQTIVQNTNDCGTTYHSTPTNQWIDLTLQDMMAYMAMVIYMGFLQCSSFTDYWRKSKLYSLSFPKLVMTGKKFLRISQALHLSSLAADAANEQNRGTAAFDRLCKIKPLYNEIREACKRNYHPSQEIAIDERMVASKARTGLKQYMKNKPTRWGYKLFVLAESKSGYTWDFFVYEGKMQGSSGKGLSYESVMDLVDTRLLGTGYKLFVDNFYTSPALFRDLLQMRIWACGTIRPHVIGFPKTKLNTLDSKSLRGSMRWIRKDSLLFVQWRDTRDVYMCSSLHTAHAGDTVCRRVKGADGQWAVKEICVPPAVKDYNRCMGGVDLSDALIGYYTVLHKTQRWYKTFFYHFMDIAIVNAYLLHKAIALVKGETPMNQKAFRETLVEELAEAGSPSTPVPPPAPRRRSHLPVYISGHSTEGRLRCKHCQMKTPTKCRTCDVPLCFVLKRNCYTDWHDQNNL